MVPKITLDLHKTLLLGHSSQQLKNWQKLWSSYCTALHQTRDHQQQQRSLPYHSKQPLVHPNQILQNPKESSWSQEGISYWSYDGNKSNQKQTKATANLASKYSQGQLTMLCSHQPNYRTAVNRWYHSCTRNTWQWHHLDHSDRSMSHGNQTPGSQPNSLQPNPWHGLHQSSFEWAITVQQINKVQRSSFQQQNSNGP